MKEKTGGTAIEKNGRISTSFLVQSSSILSKIAFTLDADPEEHRDSSSGLRISMRLQVREWDRVSGLIKKSYEDSLVLLTEVYPIYD
jgi:hypothetical protein